MLFNKEPTVIIGVVTAIIEAVIPMLLVFNIIHWSQMEVGAVMLVVGVIAKGLATVLARQNVVPIEIVDQQIQKGIDAPKGTTTVKKVKEEVKEENA